MWQVELMLLPKFQFSAQGRFDFSTNYCLFYLFTWYLTKNFDWFRAIGTVVFLQTRVNRLIVNPG